MVWCRSAATVATVRSGPAYRPRLPGPGRGPDATGGRRSARCQPTWPAWPLARARTDRALRVLRQGRGERRVARLEDIQVEALILELRDLVAARGDRPTGSLARLIEYDQSTRANLVETLQAWLDAFGDVIAASEALFLHPNTFRYRLRRVAEVGRSTSPTPSSASSRCSSCGCCARVRAGAEACRGGGGGHAAVPRDRFRRRRVPHSPPLEAASRGTSVASRDRTCDGWFVKPG